MDFSVLFYLLFAFFHAVASASGGASAGSDIQLLISFKNSLPDPKPLDSWRPGGSPCYTFTGVSCLNGAVSSVVLDTVPLSTDYQAVATSLLTLPSLEKLSLSFANLSGSLGSSRCSGTLVELDLAGNSLRGSVADVADVSASCAGLKLLNMSDNLIGQSPLGSFSAVATGVGADVLESLDLSRNKISGETDLQVLLSWPGIKHLDLRDNELSSRLPAITSCVTLQFLDISSNALFGEISNGVLGSCGNLSFLNISSNHLSGKLPRDLSYCTSLVTFSICNNNFSDELPVDAFSAMPNLKSLELCFNNLVGRLSDSLSKLSTLELLDLSSNNLSGSIPPLLCQPRSTSLTELYLQNNRFTGSIPDSLSNCSKLVSLDLSFNYLTGAIPAALGSLTQLHDLIMWQNMLGGEIPSELGWIKPLENLILENNDLTGVIPAGLCNCTSLNWLSLTSNNLNGSIPPWLGKLSNLAILKLGNNSFSGPIPPELGDCQSLVWLDLNSNRLNGSIPSTLAKQSGKIAVGLVIGKRYVYLRNIDGSSSECHGSGNLLEFVGIREEELARLPSHRVCNFNRVYMGNTQYTFNNNGSMIFLDVSYNELGGEIPKELGDMYYLMILNLGHNLLSGCIPPDLGNLRYVGVFDISHNALEGQIPPSFSSLSLLSDIDFSNNNLNGTIPVQGTLQTFPRSRYENNPDLCGFPLNPCPANWSDLNQKSHQRPASLAGSVAVGLLFSLFCIFGLVIIAVETKKRQRKNRDNISTHDIYIDSRSHSGTANTNWKLTGTKEALSIGLATFDKPLRKLTFADLLEATNGFRDCMIGSGGFGDVYRAHLKDGSVVAIKKLKYISGQGDREFTAEMETIGKIKHRNLVPLLGYCKVREERLLVYRYMKYGSLEDVLHDRKKSGIKLNWAARRKIAVGAARGLAFLHHSCIPHIIHRDMKSSNVLIDENLEARVSDFGMARWMMSAIDTHLSVSTLAGTPGYVPPEYYQYYQSFHCTTKGDVYSYGVVLLELLTGKKPTNSSDFGDNNLVGWVKQHSKLRITDVFDDELLKEDPNLVLELLGHLKIALACLEEKPLRRLTMLKVMAMFKEIQAGSSVDTITSVTASVDGCFGMVDMSLKEGKEEKE